VCYVVVVCVLWGGGVCVFMCNVTHLYR